MIFCNSLKIALKTHYFRVVGIILPFFAKYPRFFKDISELGVFLSNKKGLYLSTAEKSPKKIIITVVTIKLEQGIKPSYNVAYFV